MTDNNKKSFEDNGEETMLLALEDTSGTEVFFEIVANITQDGREFVVLYPEFDDEAEEYTILEVIRGENNNESTTEYRGIDDGNLLNAVFKRFCDEYEAEE